MTPFLRQVAGIYGDILAERDKRICFVFPSRRAAVFFRQYLSEMVRKPFFSPELITINELFAKISDLRVADRITLLQKLHSCYSRLVPGHESLDEFIFWGDMLIADFNDVDKYMADARSLFMNVADLNALKDDFSYLNDSQRDAIRRFWGHYFTEGKDGASEVKKRFGRNWNIMYPLYESFNELLSSEGLSYDGMMYRRVAGNLPACGEALLAEYELFVFVGLNALNECEKTLLRHLRDTGKADFYWDFYGGLLRDESNAASLFMRENIRDFPSRHSLEEDGDTYPEVIAVSVPSAVGEARYAGEILASLGGEVGRETAVMLPDSSLLGPLLGSVPENVGSINVTMGCPMSGSPLASFMHSLKDLQLGLRKTASGLKFYYRHVLDLLRHKYLCSEEGADEAVKNIFMRNAVYVEPSSLWTSPLLRLVFRPVTGNSEGEDGTRAMEAYFKDVLWELGTLQGGTEREFVKRYYSAVIRLSDMRLPVKPATWLKLLDALVSGISVPFKGEPLAGLQIMGPLETRALDFKNIIIVSMNEGLFPARSTDNSFIPYILRKGFGLPVYEYEDAMWAYYFYRFISRAEKVWLITDSRVGGIRGGESRYIKQLEYLYPDRTRFSRTEVSLSSGQAHVVAEALPKTPEIMELMEKRFFTGRKIFSPSSLNDYLSCPLQFYFKYVLEESPDEEVTDDLDPGAFGSWYHGVMHRLYAPFEGKEVDSRILDGMLSGAGRDLIKRTAEEVFAEKTGNSEIRGVNLVNLGVIQRLVAETLEVDKSFAPFKIVNLEKKFNAPLVLDDGRQVLLGGYIDRLDVREGRLRVIDYKTGGVNLKYDNVAAVFDRQNAKRPKIVLQMFIYQYILDRSSGLFRSLPKVNSVYSLKQMMHSAPQEFCFIPEEIPVFEDCLRKLIGEILDPGVPFSAGKEDGCKYCDFFSKCKKTMSDVKGI